MLDALNCIIVDHDADKIILAAVICALGALATMKLTRKAATSAGLTCAIWIFGAALASGVSIWATHFIAMLGYNLYPGMNFAVGLTISSLAVAIIYCGAGIALAVQPVRFAAIGGGLLIGGGISAMHYLGMSAVEIPAEFAFDRQAVVLSTLGAGVIYALALHLDRRRMGRRRLALSSGILVVGTLVIHFGGMLALTTTPDPTHVAGGSTLNEQTLAVFVAIASVFILLVSLVCIGFDDRFQAFSLAARARLKAFADAAVEGLVLCDGLRVIDANESFLRLTGYDIEALRGQDFTQIFSAANQALLQSAPVNTQIEIDLRAQSGETIPVELVSREIGSREARRHVFAIRDLRERRAAEQRIRHMAYHDVLTGLPNRARFAEVLADHVAAKRPHAVFGIDLDRFKEINDLFGHAAGDALLRHVAQEMAARLGPDDLLARIGGDEFMIIQTGGEQPRAAEELAGAIVAAVGNDFVLDGMRMRSNCSIGIAIFPQDGEDPKKLQSNADAALYRCKHEGRAGFRFFEPEMDQRLRERRAIQSEMVDGLQNGEFAVYYQPQFETTTGVLSGFEALLRWRSPTRGSVEPSVFVPLAEENGFIVELGRFVLTEACAEAACWDDDLSIGVNLSPAQFHQGTLDQEIEQVLARTGLDPRRLELEITEGVLMRDLPRAQQVLSRVKAAGVRIAMDDFGTGYSSLSYLQTFPFDRIKIDRSFIRDVDVNAQSEAIVRAIVSLGRGLGLPVVAEGVETESQHSFLATLDCHEVQGYLFSRPQPIEMFAALLKRKTAAVNVACA